MDEYVKYGIYALTLTLRFFFLGKFSKATRRCYTQLLSEYGQEYHNYKLQTNPWHREEELHNNHETSGRQTKQSNQFSLPHQDDCKTRMDIK